MSGVTGLVTVMVPSYNYAQYLRECVESAATQTGVEVDVAVVDNASTDGSLELGRRLAAEYSNVRLVVHDDNGGIITSFNRCRDEMRGEFAVLLCADDALTPGTLARSVELMNADPSVGLVYGPVIDFLDLAEVAPERFHGRDVAPIVYTGDEWIERRCRIATNPIRTPEALMRSSILDAAGRLDPSLPFTSDLNMWLRLAERADVAYLPGHPQALYRRHTNNFGAAFLTTDSAFADLEARWFAFANFFDRIGTHPMRSTWETLARNALSSEARYVATRAFVKLEPANRELVISKLLRFAAELDPSGGSAFEVIGWKLRRALGPKLSRRFPLLLPRPTARHFGRALAERSRIRTGL